MSEWIHFEKDPRHIAREKTKARKMRQSNWWKNRLAEGLCHYCGQKFAPDELTMDHVVPLARGGKSTRGNIVACCKACNNEKKYYAPVELLIKKMNDEKPSGQTA